MDIVGGREHISPVYFVFKIRSDNQPGNHRVIFGNIGGCTATPILEHPNITLDITHICTFIRGLDMNRPYCLNDLLKLVSPCIAVIATPRDPNLLIYALMAVSVSIFSRPRHALIP